MPALPRLPFCVILLVIAGCQPSNGPAVHPVAGELFRKGKPAAGVTVSCHDTAQPNGRIYRAVVKDDGTFQMTTHTLHDGLPPGSYAVTASWTDLVKVNDAERETPDKLGGRYSDPRKPITTIAVKPGDNRIPRIDLK